MSKNLKVETGDSGGSSPGMYWKESKPAQVDVGNTESVALWAKVLGIQDYELIDAVKDFGPVVKDIRRGLLMRKNDAA